MSRPLVFLDLEGTGPDPYYDRIVEMAFVDEHGTMLLNTRVNPGRPIPAEVIEVHGITDADVKDAPKFVDLAARVQEILRGVVLVGYNLIRYDTILIDRELRSAGQVGLERDTAGRIIQPEIDLFGIWQRSEPRKLVTAAKRFGGHDLGDDAHAAGADTACLPAVLDGMCRAFGHAADNLAQLVEMSRPEGFVDRDGKFVRRADGVVVFNFSQSRGQPVSGDPGLLEWMLRKDFSPETRAFASGFLDEISAAQRREVYGEGDLPF